MQCRYVLLCYLVGLLRLPLITFTPYWGSHATSPASRSYSKQSFLVGSHHSPTLVKGQTHLWYFASDQTFARKHPVIKYLYKTLCPHSRCFFWCCCLQVLAPTTQLASESHSTFYRLEDFLCTVAFRWILRRPCQSSAVLHGSTQMTSCLSDSCWSSSEACAHLVAAVLYQPTRSHRLLWARRQIPNIKHVLYLLVRRKYCDAALLGSVCSLWQPVWVAASAQEIIGGGNWVQYWTGYDVSTTL